jgi:hypothetical protein
MPISLSGGCTAVLKRPKCPAKAEQLRQLRLIQQPGKKYVVKPKHVIFILVSIALLSDKRKLCQRKN